MLLPRPKAEPFLFFSRRFVRASLTIVACFCGGRGLISCGPGIFPLFCSLASLHSLASLPSAKLGAVEMLIEVRLVDPVNESAYRNVGMQQHVDQVRRREV